jgi:hypothetical protein
MRFQTIGRLALALCAPFLLVGCILTPGKFTSTLSVSADRSFTFTYKGEVIALDMSDEMKMGAPASSDSSDAEGQESSDYQSDAMLVPVAWDGEDAKADTATTKADTERKRRAIAEMLAKEAGYKSVQYVGDGKYVIDYAITGRLDHNFVYPYNLDAEIIFPFIAIELRKNGAVRVKAPAFGDEKTAGKDSTMGMGGGGGDKTAKLRDGTFTLDTDAEIISQNNEDGVQTVNGRKTIVWKVTPLSQAAPTAVLKMKP